MNLNIPMQQRRLNTAGAVPTAAQMLEGMLVVNTVDRILFTLDHTGGVQKLGVATQDLSTVAFTGNYNDLLNKPNAGNYTLPPASAAVLGGVTVAANSGLAITAAGALTNAGVISVNSRQGNLTLTATDVGLPTDLLTGPNGTVLAKYLPTAVAGGLAFQGSWNAATNTPNLSNGGIGPSGTALANGSYFVVSTAGTTSLDGNSNWAAGDLAIVSNNVWTHISTANAAVTSVNGLTGQVTLTASNITGFATVATSGSYNDLSNKPTPYALPIATTTVLGGVLLTTTAQTAGNAASGKLSTVALTGSYNDLLNLPSNPDTARLPVNAQGSPNILTEIFYLFSEACQFQNNFAGSVAVAQLLTGTTAQFRIMRYPAATPNTGTQVGTINIDTTNGNTITSTQNGITFAVGDQLSLQPVTTNVSRLTVNMRGLWQ